LNEKAVVEAFFSEFFNGQKMKNSMKQVIIESRKIRAITAMKIIHSRQIEGKRLSLLAITVEYKLY
jgi:hypothetical protein